MDQAHIHLILNHAPAAGLAFGIFLWLLSLSERFRALRTAALVLFVISGILVIPVYLTGEGAERIVFGQPGVTRDVIHEHEDAGIFALLSVCLAGLLSLITLIAYYRKGVLPKGLAIASIVLALFSFSVITRTAYLGGQIRHTELRTGFVPVPRPPRVAPSTQPDSAR